jgi:hypothetical protein
MGDGQHVGALRNRRRLDHFERNPRRTGRPSAALAIGGNLDGRSGPGGAARPPCRHPTIMRAVGKVLAPQSGRVVSG